MAICTRERSASTVYIPFNLRSYAGTGRTSPTSSVADVILRNGSLTSTFRATRSARAATMSSTIRTSGSAEPGTPPPKLLPKTQESVFVAGLAYIDDLDPLEPLHTESIATLGVDQHHQHCLARAAPQDGTG